MRSRGRGGAILAPMPSVCFATSRGERREIDVPSGTLVLDAARRAGLPMARACGERQVCGRCVVEVRRGHSGLSPEAPRETRVKARNGIARDTRLACCARVAGDLEIAASYW